jgi:hypothetical protein
MRRIKCIIAPRFFGHDGSLNSEPIELSAEDIPYLEGVADAAANPEIGDDAQRLIAAIKKHQRIKIWTAE